MNIDLPVEGCNILTSDNSLYNYSADGHTRTHYVIYDGKLVKESEQYSQYGYSYTGTCLSTGDLVYKPELRINFEIYSLAVLLVVGYLLFSFILEKLMRLKW